MHLFNWNKETVVKLRKKKQKIMGSGRRVTSATPDVNVGMKKPEQPKKAKKMDQEESPEWRFWLLTLTWNKASCGGQIKE